MICMKILNLILQMLKLKYIGLSDNSRTNYWIMKSILNTCTRDNHILDNIYTLLSVEDMQKILKINFIKNLQYRKEIFDCDDFAFNFMWFIRNLFGNVAVGVVFIELDNGSRHALNFMVTEKREIYLIEPQDSSMVRIDGTRPYFMLI